MIRTVREGPRVRRGTVVVAALALVMLGAAILTSAAIIVSASSHAVLAERAALEAEATASASLARALTTWDVATDSLRVGSARVVALPPPDDQPGLPASVELTVQRLAGTVFALTVDVRVGGQPVLARRRVRLLVERGGPPAPGTVDVGPVPIRRWSRADLY